MPRPAVQEPNSNLRQIARTLDATIRELELQIGDTPSGTRRNQLCAAAIHVRAALGLIVEGR